MSERAPAGDVIKCLSSTSDKIRALARAGYLRTEISQLLGIRYQHVPKVLVDSGMTEGLKNTVTAERPALVVEDPARRPATTSWEVLLRANFKFVGEWGSGAGDDIQLDAKAPVEPGVYAFVLNEQVVYVGLTQTGLRTRLNHYRLGHERQRTSARVKGLIVAALAAGARIKVLVATPPASEWNGLPVNTAAGLEAGLIQMIRPRWNIRGT